ncbi:MAG: hypothetical protein WCA58_04795 [Terriglobales bacterium]
MLTLARPIAAGGSLRVRVTAVGEQTALSGIMRLVAAVPASGSHTQVLADRAAAILFHVAVASGEITFAYWRLAGDKEHALIRTATVLIIACPYAFGLAIPLVIAISTSIGAQNGLLVKDRLAFERTRNLDMVIFDKTGTLTRWSPELSGIAAAQGSNESDLLALAAAVEANSEHPLYLSDLVKDRYVVSHHRAFAAYDQAHRDALGFVVMSLVEQINCAQACAESEGGAYGFSGGAASDEGTHQWIGFTIALAQASLRREGISGD